MASKSYAGLKMSKYEHSTTITKVHQVLLEFLIVLAFDKYGNENRK